MKIPIISEDQYNRNIKEYSIAVDSFFGFSFILVHFIPYLEVDLFFFLLDMLVVICCAGFCVFVVFVVFFFFQTF